MSPSIARNTKHLYIFTYRIVVGNKYNFSRFSQVRLGGTPAEVNAGFPMSYGPEAGASTHAARSTLSDLVAELRFSQSRRPGEKTAVFRTFFGKFPFPRPSGRPVLASGARSSRLRKANLITVRCETVKRLTSRKTPELRTGMLEKNRKSGFPVFRP